MDSRCIRRVFTPKTGVSTDVLQVGHNPSLQIRATVISNITIVLLFGRAKRSGQRPPRRRAAGGSACNVYTRLPAAPTDSCANDAWPRRSARGLSSRHRAMSFHRFRSPRSPAAQIVVDLLRVFVHLLLLLGDDSGKSHRRRTARSRPVRCGRMNKSLKFQI